jgi:hypothetical protein
VTPYLSLSTAILKNADFENITRTRNNDPERPVANLAYYVEQRAERRSPRASTGKGKDAAGRTFDAA